MGGLPIAARPAHPVWPLLHLIIHSLELCLVSWASPAGAWGLG